MGHTKERDEQRRKQERPSGSTPRDEPEQGRPPVAWRDNERILEPRTQADAVVDEASEESFPASDPPAFTPSRRDEDESG